MKRTRLFLTYLGIPGLLLVVAAYQPPGQRAAARSHSAGAIFAGLIKLAGAPALVLVQNLEVVAAAPSNDNFANAQALTGNSGSVTGNNEGATFEANEPVHGGIFGGKSIWYKWQAPTSNSVNFTTFGTAFHTGMGVYLGTRLDMLTSVVQGNSLGAEGLATSLTFTASQGETYYFAIDGYESSTGTIVLSWNVGGPVSIPTPTPIVRPANDDFANAQLVAGNSGTVSGSNVNATLEASEPVHGGILGGKSIWYKWQSSATNNVNFTTFGTSFHNGVGVYTGTRIDMLTLITSGNSLGTTSTTSSVTFNAHLGDTYYIGIDANEGATGTIVLSWNVGAPVPTPTPTPTVRPPNDDFANAQAIAGNSGSVNGTNINASLEPNEPVHGGILGGKSIWYKWQAPVSNSVNFSTFGTGFHNGVGIYTGTKVDALSVVTSGNSLGSSNTTSSLTFSATQGATYYIAIDANEGATGNITLSWNVGAPVPTPTPTPTLRPPNDDFANAQVIAGSSGSVSGNNVNATLEPNEPVHGGILGGKSIWYKWQSPTTSGVTFTTSGTAFHTGVGIYTGTKIDMLTAVAGGNSLGSASTTTSVFFNANQGAAYYVAIDGNEGATGQIVLNWNAAVSTPTPTPTSTTVQFSVATYTVSEAAASASIEVIRTGDTSSAFLIDYATSDGSGQQRKDYAIAGGTLAFGAGESTKTFTVLVIDNAYLDSERTVNLALNNAVGAQLGQPNTAVLKITDNDTSSPSTNPIDQADIFVRQQYYDFLSRLPDQSGLNFWTSQITQCGTDQNCVNSKRVDVSNAFYFELEFQQTGSYVYRLYRESFGNNQPFPNPIPDPQHPGEEKKLPAYLHFMQDRSRVRGGSQLAQLQLDLANAFVQRPEFLTKYPNSLSGPDFVDAVLATIKNDLNVDLVLQRQALIDLFNQGGRANVIYRLADDNVQSNPINNRALIDAEYNRAFVFTQYAGYLRRNPDIAGFLFWLDQVNSGPMRDAAKQHGMVCAFLTSLEYQERFSPIHTRTNADCH